MRDLRPVEHDPKGWDRVAFAEWMKEKIQLQTDVANLLLAHADESRHILNAES